MKHKPICPIFKSIVNRYLIKFFFFLVSVTKYIVDKIKTRYCHF